MSTPRTQRGRSARFGWSAHCGHLYKLKRDANADATRGGLDLAYPVAVLDLSEEAVEKMVEAVASKIHGRLSAMGFNRNAPNGRPIAEAVARAALSCILPLRKRGKP